jgi:signal transduction histidine kinase
LTLSYLMVIILAMSLSGFLLLSFLERYFLQAAEDSLITQAHITSQALIPGSTTRMPPEQANTDRSNLASAYNTLQQRQVQNLSLQTENLLLPPDAPPPGDTGLSYLADTSLQFSTQLETRIRILDTQGVVLVDSWQEQEGTNLQVDPLVSKALAGEYASQTDQGSQEPAMHVALPALVENQLVGVIYLSQPLNDIITVLADLRIRWLLATVIALVLSGGGGLLLSQAIASPVRRLTEAAEAVAQGKFNQQVPVRSKDELGRLSQTFNDMTARLRAARQMQINFVANVSHELRTPLTSIKGIVETLQDGAVDDLSVRDHFLQTVEGETDRLIRLVNDLLILSRADSEALNLRRESRDMREVVQTTLNRLTPQAQSRKVTLKLAANPNARPAWIDPDRIEQVLVNLVDNAIKYSQAEGTVTVNVTNGQDHSVLVQVCDQGIGIPAEDLPRIGERFYRADKARSRAEGGSGLGLAIAQALVIAHGGQLWLESQEGEGTVVSFTLPST